MCLFAVLASAALAEVPDATKPVAASKLERLGYNDPNLTVDLGVGLWAWPLPMDYDADGDLDLVVSCPDVPSNGTYFFENRCREKNGVTVFKPGVRIGVGLQNLQVSYVDGEPRVLGPAVEYQDFRNTQFASRKRLPLPVDFHKGKLRANQWKYSDLDGDGNLDLVIGIEDWSDYGWDNAFDTTGRWTNGPLHGFAYFARNRGTNDQPDYEVPQKLTAAGKEIDVYGMPSPNLADFDGDGDLDLLCGEFIDRLTYFENVGGRTGPKFREGRKVQAAGSDLRVDLCMMVPVAIDWDRDRHIDLVIGQEDGRVMLARHTGQFIESLPQFERPRYFQQRADGLKFGALVTPVGFDWDHDGDEDLVCGNTAGEIGFIENLDGSDPPRWAVPKLVEAGSESIRIQAGPSGSIQGPCETKWGYTTFSIADWDQDGLSDLIVNSIWGKVIWYRNVGSHHEPKFALAAPIEVEWDGETPKPAWIWWKPEEQELATQWRTTPSAIDWDHDGLIDLVMMDMEGYLAFYRRERRDGQLVLLPPMRSIVDKQGKPLRMNARAAGKSGRRKFCITDWDGDGDLDLLADSRNVELFQGSGWNDGKYRLRRVGDFDGRRLAGHDTSPTTVDWNRDGKRDLVVGAEDGHFYYLKNSTN